MASRLASFPAGTAPTLRLIPLAKWSDCHSWPSVAGLRAYVAAAERIGGDAWIRRVGRRLLIDELAFLAWAADGSIDKSRRRNA